MHSWSFSYGETGLSSNVCPPLVLRIRGDFLLELDSSLIISLALGLNPFAHVTCPLTGI